MKPLLALLLVGITSLVHAQDMATFLVRCTTPVDPWVRKMAGHVIQEQEPSALLSFDGQLIKIGTHGHATGAELVQALNGAGIGTFELVSDPRKNAAGPTFPREVDTGHPDGDRTAYREAKRAWIAAHPEAYREMINDAPQPVKTDRVTSPE